MGYLALMAVVLAAAGLGIGWRRLHGCKPVLGSGLAWVECLLVGQLALFLWSVGLRWVGLPWSWISWLLPLGLGAWLALAELRRLWQQQKRIDWRQLEWGDGVAFGAWLCFALAAHLLWSANPDFVYHWGVKAQKYLLVGGVDVDFLQLPWNVHIHADYPNLLPTLMALPAVLLGRFEVAPALAFSTLCFALTLLAARDLSRSLALGRWARNVAVAVVGLVGVMFGVGYLSAGGADWLVLVAIMTAAAVLSRPPGGAADRMLAVAAAFAAVSKIEGAVLAVAMVAVQMWRHGRQGGIRSLRSMLVLCWPAALMVGPWLALVLGHDLFQRTNVGGFAWSKAAVVFPELGRSLLTLNWHYLSLVLLLLPLLVADRRLRPIVALVSLQLGFYVYIYMAGSHDPGEWVRTSAARLYFHLVPVALVAGVAFVDGWEGKAGRSRIGD